MYWSGRRLEQMPVHGVAVDLLRRQIHLGQLRPDEQLPAERKLSQTLGIARVTLREAIRVLEDGEYFCVRRGVKGGTFVAPEEKLNEIALRQLLKDPGNAWRHLECLQANLLAAAGYAADRRSPADLIVLGRITGLMERSTSGAALREARSEFLSAIGTASANPFFKDAILSALDGLFHPIDADRFERLYGDLSRLCADTTEALRQRDAATVAGLCRKVVDWIAVSLQEGMCNWRMADTAEVGKRPLRAGYEAGAGEGS